MSRRKNHNPSESLASTWYKGVSNSAERKQELRDAVSSPAAQRTLKQIILHLETELESVEKELYSNDSYALPAWSENVADKIGARRALQHIHEFIKGAVAGE